MQDVREPRRVVPHTGPARGSSGGRGRLPGERRPCSGSQHVVRTQENGSYGGLDVCSQITGPDSCPRSVCARRVQDLSQSLKHSRYSTCVTEGIRLRQSEDAWKMAGTRQKMWSAGCKPRTFGFLFLYRIQTTFEQHGTWGSDHPRSRKFTYDLNTA